MDRQIVYVGQIPQDTDQLQQNKNTMIGLGFALQAILGTSTLFDGLACTPNSPAALNVLVGPGSVYSLQNVDGTAYGSLAPDTANQIVKQGIIETITTLNTPAPGTPGQSINYLVQATYQDVDSGSTVLPYYNASNPAVAYNGPNNTGVSQNTVRKGECVITVKAGTAATTGTQTTPAPDAGYTGLFVVTVANGQSTVTSGNISQLSTAPFISTKLPNVNAAIQYDAPNFATDTSGAASTITVALSPDPGTLGAGTNGMPIRVKVANSSTGATVMNVNGHGNIACKTTSGAAFTTNTVVANGIYTFVYDANGSCLQLQGFTAASATGLLPANNLSDVSNPATSLANLSGASTATTISAAGLATGGGSLAANRTITVTAATKSDMQTATSTTVVPTPAQLQNHPGIAKVTANIVGSSGAINESYGVSSVVRNSTGNYTVNFSTNFANTNYVITGNGTRTGGAGGQIGVDTANKTTSSCIVQYQGTGGSTPTDPLTLEIAIFGKQ